MPVNKIIDLVEMVFALAVLITWDTHFIKRQVFPSRWMYITTIVFAVLSNAVVAAVFVGMIFGRSQ